LTLSSRGEVWLIDLGDPIGHEQGYERPGLIVSDDILNHGSSGVVIVLPITSKLRNIPVHVNIKRGEAGLSADSCVQCDHPRALSKLRFIKPLGIVRHATMRDVEDRLRVVLSLP
jgi:mRNA interferase MazF